MLKNHVGVQQKAGVLLKPGAQVGLLTPLLYYRLIRKHAALLMISSKTLDVHQCIHPLGIQLCLELPVTWGKSLTPSTSIVLSLFLVGICEHKGCGCSVSRSTLPHP